MNILRSAIFFFFVFIVSAMVVLSGLSLSFLESSLSSFSFIRISSDNRARDTIVSLAKASEGRLNPKGYPELNQTFSRLKDVTQDDKDGFHILEIVLTDLDGNILASSEEKPDKSRYSSDVFNRAFRMRKWQYPDPILLDMPLFQKDLTSNLESKLYNYLEPVLNRYFPEAKETTALVSSAVYHQTKLDVLGAIHLIYVRGNYPLFLDKQKEMYLWIVSTYAVVVLAFALLVTLLYSIFSYFNRKNSHLDIHTTLPGETKPPIIQRIVVDAEIEEENLVNTKNTEVAKSSDESTTNLEKVNDISPPKVPSHYSSISSVKVMPNVNTKKNVVVDAIFMGDYGD